MSLSDLCVRIKPETTQKEDIQEGQGALKLWHTGQVFSAVCRCSQQCELEHKGSFCNEPQENGKGATVCSMPLTPVIAGQSQVD